jgi:MFS family permease
MVMVLPVVLRAGVLFYLNAFLLGSFLSRIPDFLVKLETDKAMLGLALFAAPVGSMVAAPFIGRLIDVWSPGRMAIVSGVLLSLVVGTIGFAPTVLALALILFVAGIINGFMEVSMNAAADRLEKHFDLKIIARCHGFWSLGFMTGALIAGAMAQAGIGVAAHLGVATALGVAGTLAISRIYPALAFLPTVHQLHEEKPPVFALPNRLTIGVCMMGVGVTLAEGAIYDWGNLYLRADIGAAPLPAAVAFACFTLAMAAGRFGGDAVRERMEAPAIVRACSLMTAVGLLGFVLSPNAFIAALMLILMGAGVSLVFPIAVTSVSTKGGSPSANIASLSLAVMAALLTGPPLIGILAEAFGLGAALLCTMPAAALSFFLASHASSPAPVVTARVDAPAR